MGIAYQGRGNMMNQMDLSEQGFAAADSQPESAVTPKHH